MACVAVLSLMRTMELEFLQPRPRPILQQKELLIPPNIELIQSLHGKLQSLIELFDENRMDGVEAIKILETRLRDVAFRVEDEIELQVVHLYQEEERDTRGPRGCSMLCQIVHRPKGNPREYNDVVESTCPSLTLRYILQQAIEHIDAIKEELVKVKEEYELSKDLQGRNAAFDVFPKPDDEVIMMADSSHHALHSKEIMVGKQDEFEIIKKKLIQHPSHQLEVFSIKGMGGIGKTTLAKKIYKDSSITSHFDKQAWTVASQHHSKRQMLLDLLGSKDDADKSSDEDLALQLYQSLKRLRYLIVIDDVWSVEAWDALKTCFPDDGYGSRVLLTTRIGEVANHICTQNDFSHQMQLLEQSESWKLFNEKACKSRGAEFETIGRPVVEKCKGLPLAIIVVAGLFSKLITLDEWKNTANALSFSSTTTLDDEECLRILSLSYNHLSHNLKACFLYLGVFPEDHKIHANNLARLWLAEGLVKAFENENFDAVANRYMQELMDRNLIILSQLCSRGRKIKSFRMHDLLHDFCVREAQKENLLYVVRSENRSDFPHKNFRWVSIQSVNFDMSTIHSQSKSCKSFFYFLLEESSLKLNDFNLLRVLYSSTKFMKFVVLMDIVHLRLLIVKQDVKLSRDRRFLKSRSRKDIELSKSWNLQTLICSRKVSCRSDDGGNCSEFPKLHYIRCYDGFIHGYPPSFVHKLFRIRVDDCSQEYIKNIPFLKKVGIVCEGRDDYSGCFTNLASSEQLEGLHFGGPNQFYVHTQFTNHIVLLKNLRTLSLFFVVFDSDGIDILSKLPKLEVLKLKHTGFQDAKWKIQQEVIFCQLIFLEIFFTPLEHWEASSHNFPKLEHLYIRFCYKLREIPIDFAEISTLKSIKLSECLHSAVESAKKIQDEQRDYGNDDMVVIKKETLNVSESEETLSEEELDQKWITDN